MLNLIKVVRADRLYDLCEIDIDSKIELETVLYNWNIDIILDAEENIKHKFLRECSID